MVSDRSRYYRSSTGKAAYAIFFLLPIIQCTYEYVVTDRLII